MSSQHLKNIELPIFRKFLEAKGCSVIRTNGGHEVWTRKDFLRPIVLQTHINPIPEFIIKNCLKNLGCSKKDFFDWFSNDF